jgi:hypothetical protein
MIPQMEIAVFMRRFMARAALLVKGPGDGGVVGSAFRVDIGRQRRIGGIGTHSA